MNASDIVIADGTGGQQPSIITIHAPNYAGFIKNVDVQDVQAVLDSVASS